MDDERVLALSQQARQALAEGNAAQARQLYAQAVALHAESADAHFGLATACFLLKDLPAAAEHFKEVTRLDARRAGAYVNLGAIYNRLDQLDEAAAALRRGIQLDSRRAEGYYNLGLVYKRQGKVDLAIDAYREATRLNPRMLDAHYNLANVMFEQGRYSQAAKHYRLALDINSQFEKAAIGLQESEKALQASRPRTPVFDQPTPVVFPLPRRLSDEELHRTLDPLDDGMFLSAMHKATIEAEKSSRAFLHVLEQEIEPAVKDLSANLLYPEKVFELSSRVHKLETAMQKLLDCKREMQTCMKRLHKIGEHPPVGTPLEGSTSA